MKRYLLALCGAFFLFAGLPVYAQGILTIRPVTACGSPLPFPAFVAGGNGFLLQDLNGNLCTSAAVGSAITGPLGPSTTAANSVAVAPGAGSTFPISGTVTNNQSGTAGVGGITGFSRIASGNASTNLTVAKASPGRVYKITVTNTTASPIYIKFYNVASGAVVGTTPVFFSRTITPSATSNYDFGGIGAYFSAGISYAVVNGSLDADATAVAAAAFIQLEVAFQ